MSVPQTKHSQWYCLKLDIVANYPRLKQEDRNTILASKIHAAWYEIQTTCTLTWCVLKLRVDHSFWEIRRSKVDRIHEWDLLNNMDRVMVGAIAEEQRSSVCIGDYWIQILPVDTK